MGDIQHATHERANMTWTMAAEITREKINKGIDRPQRANLTDVDKAKAVMEK